MFGDEILVDKAKNGKVRPWKEKKLANLTYAEYLQILEIKKAFRVKKCGNLLTFPKSEIKRFGLIYPISPKRKIKIAFDFTQQYQFG